MKPIRRTQVITIMAACAISIAAAEQTPPAQPAPAPLPRVEPFGPGTLREQLEAAREAAAEAQEAMRDKARLDMIDQAREMAQEARNQVESLNMDMIGPAIALAQEVTPRAATAPLAPLPPMPPRGAKFMYDSGSYESGKSALDNHNYDRAVEIFDRVINARNPSTRIEGAYYWKAYALNKLGKRDEALAALGELTSKYPQSSWLNDAKALQAEVQAAKGQPVAPENQADEDLKLYAINALINSDPERAVPLLESLLNNPKMSPKLKERALFVLAQSRSDKAHDIVGRYAKGGANPDLQLAAVQYLGTYRSKESRQELSDIYASVSDVNVKRAVLRGYQMSRDTDHLAQIAKSEQNLDLRHEAVRYLGNLHEDQATATLVSIYGTESDRDIKSEILNSLRNQGAAKQIIECARKESDPDLKKQAVRMLSEMHSKEATDFLMEILK